MLEFSLSRLKRVAVCQKAFLSNHCGKAIRGDVEAYRPAQDLSNLFRSWLPAFMQLHTSVI
jgi:hypothetical protein